MRRNITIFFIDSNLHRLSTNIRTNLTSLYQTPLIKGFSNSVPDSRNIQLSDYVPDFLIKCFDNKIICGASHQMLSGEVILFKIREAFLFLERV